MLVLTRKENETVCIGHRLIQITVLSIRGDYVRLGIDCPKDIPVHREEVQTQIEEAERG